MPQVSLTIPERFQKKLSNDQKLEGIIKTTVSEYAKILDDNTLYFFPEYTDHGIKHIENILNGADRLIPDSTFELLSDSDIGYFILTAVLHDLGMHFYHSTFSNLIQDKVIAIPDIDKKSWHDEWLAYLYEARKFDKKKLIQIFGNEDVNVASLDISDKAKITEEGKKLVGEFIRRNHPRIAHEIALNGFHTDEGRLRFADELRKDIRDLVGFCARSHGMDLRAAAGRLESQYPGVHRKIHNTHFIYLMIILRLADYLDIDNSRSSSLLLRLKSFSTPFSIGEHRAHLAVDYVTDEYQDDKEKIFVRVSPENSAQFVKLRNLVAEIQREFDISWAVLGENYSRLENEFRIKYRRISSNLDDQQYREKLEYVPQAFSFKVSESLIKLLIRPLYGNSPSYGIRELIQNAIDACSEREMIDQSARLLGYTGNVSIDVDKDYAKGKYFFKIEDDGKGMNESDLQNYFLMIGGSNRADVEWSKATLSGLPPQIRKSGKFGIGVLAGFLLGPEIEVETRKYNQQYGLTFTANINSEQINVFKEPAAKIGTSIKIYVDDRFIKVLGLNSTNKGAEMTPWYGWYTLPKPKVKYTILTAEVAAYKKYNPHLDDELPATWNKFVTTDYDAICWTYDESYCKKSLTCNGIVVPIALNDLREFLAILNKDGDLITYNEDFDFIFNLPNLSIFDSKGNLPLSLNRNTLTDYLTFSRQLRFEILKDIITTVITGENHSVLTTNHAVIGEDVVRHPSLNKADGIFGKRIVSLEGVSVLLPHVKSKRKHVRVALNGAVSELKFDFKPGINYTFEHFDSYGSEEEQAKKSLKISMLDRLGLLLIHLGGVALEVKRNNNWLKREQYSNSIKSIFENEDVMVYSGADYSEAALKKMAEVITPENVDQVKFVIFDFDLNVSKIGDDRLIAYLSKVFGDEELIIPYEKSQKEVVKKQILEKLDRLLIKDFV